MCLVMNIGCLANELRSKGAEQSNIQKLLEGMRPTALQACAETCAAAYLSREPLELAEGQMLTQLWPSLAAFSVSVATEAPTLACCPEQQDFQLYVRVFHGSCCAVTLPMPVQAAMPGGSCTFQFAQPSPDPHTVAELQQFVARLQTCIAHQSKVVMEDAWEELVSRLPREAAISLLRDCCMGKQVLQESLMKAAVRRTASAPLPPAGPGDDEWAAELDVLLPVGRCHST